jgi:hypothetical protein
MTMEKDKRITVAKIKGLLTNQYVNSRSVDWHRVDILRIRYIEQDRYAVKLSNGTFTMLRGEDTRGFYGIHYGFNVYVHLGLSALQVLGMITQEEAIEFTSWLEQKAKEEVTQATIGKLREMIKLYPEEAKEILKEL